jgi:predicted nucleic-acid-binding Zn-ribbon protein
MEAGQKADRPCPVCGGDSYSWGSVGAQGINFTPDDASVLSKLFRVGLKLPARRCNGCGNVQLFSAPPESEA